MSNLPDSSEDEGGTLPFEPREPEAVRPVRRIRLPLFLFIATCLSTFYVGAMSWMPLRGSLLLNVDSKMLAEGKLPPIVGVVAENWQQGLLYMAAVLAILLTHEMGHFLMTLRYRIPASFPIFIPIPVNAVGTLGAVISMDGMKANRKELFDLGIAGPLAGLVVAIPILCLGIHRLEFSPTPGGMTFHNPMIVEWLIAYLRPDLAVQRPELTVSISELNPYFMAGWVGLLITGLNMLPISQLDGGHVVYTLFGRKAHLVARGFLVFAILFILIYEIYLWTIMLVLVILIGTDHPPTSDDSVPLGGFRRWLGLSSLLIPILCFPALGVSVP